MNEVQYSIALNGAFLFRTDWQDDSARCDEAQEVLQKKFPLDEGYRLTRSTRGKAFYSNDITK